MMRILICAMLCLVLGKAATAADALFVDPAPDKAHPARMETVRIPTRGELLSNGSSWSFKDIAPAISAIPMLIITADDGLASEVSLIAASAQHAHKIRIATDYPYSDKRIALERAVADWLRKLK